ncbi:hypothetical protein [Halanaeroarchaeum sp. HSR-CO]|uniref:hypothetical protein n=1 Tax=Halanaeroarchaeum sp. HSR-CO TaxID=2866382 RepID=UPI00217E18B2|nr:hypothetical protein [Halanaeroarchaeum sp. HSR-CO]
MVYMVHHWVGTVPGEAGPDLGKMEMDQALDSLDLELDHSLDTAVSNLEKAGLLGKYEPDGPDWWLIRQRDGEFVMGEDFPPAVQDECQRAIKHIRGMDPSDEGGTPAVADGGHSPKTNDEGETLRQEVSRKLDVKSGELEGWLSAGDAKTRRQKLENLVGVISGSDYFEAPDSFDEISLIPKGYRYHRSEFAVNH